MPIAIVAEECADFLWNLLNARRDNQPDNSGRRN